MALNPFTVLFIVRFLVAAAAPHGLLLLQASTTRQTSVIQVLPVPPLGQSRENRSARLSPLSARILLGGNSLRQQLHGDRDIDDGILAMPPVATETADQDISMESTEEKSLATTLSTDSVNNSLSLPLLQPALVIKADNKEAEAASSEELPLHPTVPTGQDPSPVLHGASRNQDQIPVDSDSEGVAVISYFKSTFSFVVSTVASVLLFGCCCLVLGFCTSRLLSGRWRHGATRLYIESLPVCMAEDIKHFLPNRGGYDCIISRPLSSKQLVRLEVFVQQPIGQSLLVSPLRRQRCLVFEAVAFRKLHDGVHPVPEAYACKCLDFTAALAETPSVTVEVRGADLSLFEMRHSRFSATRRLKHIPEAWKDFILTHRAAPSSAPPDASSARLEFRESTLLVGALVTLVGELHRGPTGQLSLRPRVYDEERSEGKARGQERERWRTSWEYGSDHSEERSDGDAEGGGSTVLGSLDFGSTAEEPKIEKVLVCDDETLLSAASHRLSEQPSFWWPTMVKSFEPVIGKIKDRKT